MMLVAFAAITIFLGGTVILSHDETDPPKVVSGETQNPQIPTNKNNIGKQ